MQFYRKPVPLESIDATLSAKWPIPVLMEGYVPLPKTMLRCLPKLFRGKRRMTKLAVVLAMVDFLRPKRNRWPSVQYLAFLAGLSPERVKETIGDLCDEGLIAARFVDDSVEYNLGPLHERIRKLAPIDG